MLTLFSTAAGLEGAPELSAGITVFQSLLGLTQTFANSGAGDAADRIQTQVSNLEDQASQAFPVIISAIDMLFGNIVTDYGKLKIVGEHRLN